MGGRESIRLTLVLAVVGLAGAATVAGLELVSGDSLGELPLLLLVVLYVGLLVGLTTTIRRMSHEAEEIEHMALYDSLTELPNRILFQDVVERAMSMAERQGTTAAVLLMDLDRFKEINDTLGHHNGDLLLHVIATRLRRALRSSDTVARLGGDEFAVLVPNVRGHSGGA
jgi:predicted signal transduction protein with EAL and GGDEF domain